MYSKPLVMETLKTAHTSFQINFQFQNNITLLLGDSGIGKTVIFSILQELAVEYDKLLCINYLDINKNIFKLLKDTKGKLIIVDNADILLTDDIRKWIAFDCNNQYLIIGRNPKNLLATADNLYTLKQTTHNDIISFSLENYL